MPPAAATRRSPRTAISAARMVWRFKSTTTCTASGRRRTRRANRRRRYRAPQMDVPDCLGDRTGAIAVARCGRARVRPRPSARTSRGRAGHRSAGTPGRKRGGAPCARRTTGGRRAPSQPGTPRVSLGHVRFGRRPLAIGGSDPERYCARPSGAGNLRRLGAPRARGARLHHPLRLYSEQGLRDRRLHVPGVGDRTRRRRLPQLLRKRPALPTIRRAISIFLDSSDGSGKRFSKRSDTGEQILRAMVKLPAIIADLGVGVLLYAVARRFANACDRARHGRTLPAQSRDHL